MDGLHVHVDVHMCCVCVRMGVRVATYIPLSANRGVRKTQVSGLKFYFEPVSLVFKCIHKACL